MSTISNGSNALSNLTISNRQVGDSIGKTGLTLDDPSLVGAAAGASKLDAASLLVLSKSLASMKSSAVAAPQAAFAPGAPGISKGKIDGYAAEMSARAGGSSLKARFETHASRWST